MYDDWYSLGITALVWVGIIAIIIVIWLVVEAALTVKKTRSTVERLTERIDPTLKHIESITASLEPVVTKIDPLIQRATLTVDTVNLELMRVDQILKDVNSVTETLDDTVKTIDFTVKKVSNISQAPVNFLSDTADRIRGIITGKTASDSALIRRGKHTKKEDFERLLREEENAFAEAELREFVPEPEPEPKESVPEPEPAPAPYTEPIPELIESVPAPQDRREPRHKTTFERERDKKIFTGRTSFSRR